MEFKHIHEVQPYPQLPTAEGIGVFTEQKFNPQLWAVGTTLKLCNVNWCGDYDNAVKFEDDAARDAYFDSIPGVTFEIKTPLRINFESSIELPVPFDSAAGFNYLVAEYSPAPVGNDLPTAQRRFYYFVNSISATRTAQSSNLFLSLDYWTNYINSIEINWMQLERGHAPITLTDVDRYLADPLHNTDYLMTPDVNFGEADAVASAAFVPFGAGDKLVLLATSIKFEDLGKLGYISDISPIAPVYYSDGTRNGEDATVSSLRYAAGGRDYSAITRPVSPTVSNSSVPNGYQVVAINPADIFAGFFEHAVNEAPQLMESIAAMFVVPANMVELGDTAELFKRTRLTWKESAQAGKTWYELAGESRTYAEFDADSATVFGVEPGGFTVYECEPLSVELDTLKLTRDLFGYPERYADLAKLYTHPYSFIRVTDTDGKTAEIKIERTTSVSVRARCAIAFPYLRFESFLTGIGSDSVTEFDWVDLKGQAYAETIPAGDFRAFSFGFDIPTFELRIPGPDTYALHNYNANNTMPETRAVLDYENGARSANTSLANAIDSQRAAYANTTADIATGYVNESRTLSASLTNALDSNATGQENANASAATSRDNANASNATGNANALRSNAISQENANASANAGQVSALAANHTSYANTYAGTNTATRKTEKTKKKNDKVLKANNDTAKTLKNRNQEAATRTTGQANAWSAFQTDQANALLLTKSAVSVAELAMQGASAFNSYATVGGTAGQSDTDSTGSDGQGAGKGLPAAATWGIEMGGNALTYVQSKAYNDAMVREGAKQNEAQLTIRQDTENDNYDTTRANSEAVQLLENTYISDINSLDIELTKGNANRTKDTADANAKRARDTTVANAQRSRTVGDTNANEILSTANANTARGYATTTANAQRSRTTADNNARRSNATAVANLDASTVTRRTNADRSNTVALANPQQSRDTTIENAQRSLEAGAELARAAYLDRRLDAPVTVANASGDAVPDLLRWRGLQIQIVTEKADEIAQAGDYFLRYGYACERAWPFDGFNKMKHFTYWKCSDLWMCGDAGINELPQSQIKRILLDGVTVWRDPDDIGQVSIYDNAKE